MKSKPIFSVVVIAKDEEKALPRLLYSLSEFLHRGGQLVVGDGGSEDDTRYIARAVGAEVYLREDLPLVKLDALTADTINERFEVKGEGRLVAAGDEIWDCADIRNRAVAHAASDWVANPDADEFYTSLDIEEVERAMGDPAGPIVLNTVFLHNRDGEGRPVMKFRHEKIWDRRKAHYTGLVHESIVDRESGGAPRPVAVMPESAVMLEHAQRPRDRATGTLRQLAYAVYLNPANARASYYLGRQLAIMDRPRSAIREFERRVKMEGAWPAETAQALIYSGDCHRFLGDITWAVGCYKAAFQIDPTRREALLRLAVMSRGVDDPVGTLICAAGALQIPWRTDYPQLVREYEDAPHEMLAWALRKLGNVEGAEEQERAATAAIAAARTGTPGPCGG